MKCENCKEEEATHQLMGSFGCEDCWREYWKDNDIGEEESFQQFKEFTLKEVLGGAE